MLALPLPFGLIVLLTILFMLLYKYSRHNHDYWRNKGVPFAEPLPFVGNFLEVITLRTTIGHYMAKLYHQFQTPFFGIYILHKPWLVIKSPELIKSILVTDFNCFPDRNLVCDEECDPLIAHSLPGVKNPEWKKLRSKLSPIFSITKIKNMAYLMTEVAEEMVNYIQNNISNEYLDAKEISSKYTIDVIATCAFGIKAHCFEDENAEFRTAAKSVFDFNWKNALRQSCYFMAPSIVKFFKLPFFDETVSDFARKAIWTAIEERKKTKSKRNDLIDILIQLMEDSDDNVKFEGDRVVAQALVFYAAGFETTSTTLAFTLYELCLNEEIQHKVREEIKTVLYHHGEITYEALQNLKYMNMVIYETMRKYPAVPFIERMCVKDYPMPKTDIVIEKGVSVCVPILGLHWDSQFFPEPEKFDPTRFSDKGSEIYCYLPFGDGPRACIGSRFGMAEIKIVLARLLSEFELKKSIHTPDTIQCETKGFLIAPKGGLPVKFKKIV